MRKNCETCKHDDADYPSYPHKTPCNECVRKKGCDTPTEWEAAAHYKPDTHADRIRAMSDEELAELLVQKTVYQESAWSEPSYLNFLTSRDDTKENAIKGTVEWLKQPAEDSL